VVAVTTAVDISVVTRVVAGPKLVSIQVVVNVVAGNVV
jgi:hypothetical protein